LILGIFIFIFFINALRKHQSVNASSEIEKFSKHIKAMERNLQTLHGISEHLISARSGKKRKKVFSCVFNSLLHRLLQ